MKLTPGVKFINILRAILHQYSWAIKLQSHNLTREKLHEVLLMLMKLTLGPNKFRKNVYLPLALRNWFTNFFFSNPFLILPLSLSHTLLLSLSTHTNKQVVHPHLYSHFHSNTIMTHHTHTYSNPLIETLTSKFQWWSRTKRKPSVTQRYLKTNSIKIYLYLWTLHNLQLFLTAVQLLK